MLQKIRFYSTNIKLDSTSGIVPFKGSVSFKEALLRGQAPDEGLFMPDSIPTLSLHSIMALRGKAYARAAMLVAKAFLADEISDKVLK